MKREKTYKLQQSEKEIFEFRFSTIHWQWLFISIWTYWFVFTEIDGKEKKENLLFPTFDSFVLKLLICLSYMLHIFSFATPKKKKKKKVCQNINEDKRVK